MHPIISVLNSLAILWMMMNRESETTQLAYVTFKEPQGVDTAVLLSVSVLLSNPGLLSIRFEFLYPFPTYVS